MNSIQKYFNTINIFEWSPVAIDKCHSMLLFGALVSYKPEKVLEIGIGSGFATRALLSGIEYNQKGSLTCVDSWHDWNGEEPAHIEELRNQGATIVKSKEETFVKNCKPGEYDFIVADGDHRNSHLWAEDTYKLAKVNGLLFFHDVSMSRYPGLKRFIEIAEEKGYSYILFDKSTLESEMCERGWLMVRKTNE